MDFGDVRTNPATPRSCPKLSDYGFNLQEIIYRAALRLDYKILLQIIILGQVNIVRPWLAVKQFGKRERERERGCCDHEAYGEISLADDVW